MKLLLFPAIFLFSLACAQAQSAGREPKETSKLNKHPELASRSLSEVQLQAYTKRAKQKLADALDYMQIAVSSTYTETQQKQALKQLQGLFWEVPAWAKTLPALQQYVGKQVTIALLQTEVKENLAYQNPKTYKGSLAYTWTIRSNQTVQKKDMMSFGVRKNIKTVGSQEIEVWEVFLGLF